LDIMYHWMEEVTVLIAMIQHHINCFRSYFTGLAEKLSIIDGQMKELTV